MAPPGNGRVGEDVATLTPRSPGRADFPHLRAMVQLTVFARQIHTNPSTFVLEIRIQVNCSERQYIQPFVFLLMKQRCRSAGIVSLRDRRLLVARLAAS